MRESLLQSRVQSQQLFLLLLFFKTKSHFVALSWPGTPFVDLTGFHLTEILLPLPLPSEY